MELLTEEERRFQRREWATQRVGTAVLVAFVLAALAGLLGGAGPLALTTRSSAGGLVSVELDRVTRFKADDTITLTFAPQATEDGTITLELTRTWGSGVVVQGITPEPLRQRALPDGVAMTFLAAPSGETEVSLSFRAGEHLALEGRATVGGETVEFTQFVLP